MEPLGPSRLQILGAVNLNSAVNGSITPWQKGSGKVTGTNKNLTALVKHRWSLYPSELELTYCKMHTKHLPPGYWTDYPESLEIMLKQSQL